MSLHDKIRIAEIVVGVLLVIAIIVVGAFAAYHVQKKMPED